jgi:hypothetical protein
MDHEPDACFWRVAAASSRADRPLDYLEVLFQKASPS